jgi:hypothetical protein
MRSRQRLAKLARTAEHRAQRQGSCDEERQHDQREHRREQGDQNRLPRDHGQRDAALQAEMSGVSTGLDVASQDMGDPGVAKSRDHVPTRIRDRLDDPQTMIVDETDLDAGQKKRRGEG